jgi:group I intron endonuclease
MEDITIPFTYCLTHVPTNRRYYGVRYKKGCCPADLWDKYFSSSRTVQILINKYGLSSFTCEIRKTFSNKQDAINWEHKVLRRLKVVGRSEWINANVGKASQNDGRKFSNQTKLKMSLSQIGEKNGFFGKTHTEEARKKISEGNQGRTHTEETKKHLSEVKKGKPFSGYNSNTPDAIRKRALANTGKKRTLEQRERMRKAHLGKSPSDETKQKMRLAQLNRKIQLP